MSSADSPYDPELSEETAELIAQYHDVTTGDFDNPENVLSEGVVLHEADEGEERHGFDAVVDGFHSIQEAFPDATVEVNDIVAQADTAASRWTFSATFEREYDGIEPTGETFKLTGISMFNIEDDEISEIWDRVDTHLMKQQLGVVDES